MPGRCQARVRAQGDGIQVMARAAASAPQRESWPREDHMATAAPPARKQAYSPPPVASDCYKILDVLDAKERTIAQHVREFAEAEIAPIIEDYWLRDEFPHEIIPKLSALNIAGIGYLGYGAAGGSWLLNGMVAMELSRVDSSMATFWGVHTGLSAGSIYLCGNEEQKERWLPAMMRWEKIGSFGLTEPLVGSGTSGGMLTTCRREGESWSLNGQKKWIGNATFSDVNVIWARDEASGEVKGFVVEKDNPGFSVEKIKTKMALRVVQNGLITLKDCHVPEADRLQAANTFKDCGKVLRMTRTGVAWFAVGCQMGAYEHALRYAHERVQFGKPIGGFQLVQDLLVRMLGNVTSCQ